MVKDVEALKGDFEGGEVEGYPGNNQKQLGKMYQMHHSFSRLHDKLHLIFQASCILK